MKNIKKRIIFILIPLFTIIFSCAQNDLFDKIDEIENNSDVYYVKYDANGGSGGLPFDGTKYYKNSKVTLSFPEDDAGNELTKSGYIFAGWSTVNTAVNSPEYSSDDIYIMQESDVTFYAQWCPLPNFDFDSAVQIGTSVEITSPSNINFVYAKNGSSTSSVVFPIEGNNTKTINSNFFISDTVVTNDLFTKVLQWALNKGEIKENNSGGSDANRITTDRAKYGTKVLIEFTDSDISYSNGGGGKKFSVNGRGQCPVTGVTLYGAIMFCNWLTAILDVPANKVYSGMIPTAWSSTTANYNQKGYRLPTDAEWEYAARFMGCAPFVPVNIPGQYITVADDCISSTKSGWTLSGLTAGYYWAPYNYLSGAKTSIDNTNMMGSVTAGTYWSRVVAVFGQSFTAEVKSKEPNALHLYDMSGNVWEWCLKAGVASISDSQCERRGGSYNTSESNISDLVVSKVVSATMETKNKQTGFRLAKTR